MKIFSFIFLALAAAFCSSCVLNRIEHYEPERDIVFDVVISTNTKGNVDSSYPKDMPFGIWSYSLPCEKSWAADNQDAQIIQDHQKVMYEDSDGFWKPEGNPTWVDSDQNMSFFAYSPYSRECEFSKDDGLCISGYSIDEGPDLFFSDGLYDFNKNDSNGIVHIPFVRALTKVRFSIRSSLPDETCIVVKQLKLSEVATKADFSSLPMPRWEEHSKHQEVLFFDGEIIIDHDLVILGEGVYMLPQKLKPTITLLCDIVSGDYVLHDQIMTADASMTWSIGKTCTYQLKVTTDLAFIIESILNELNE